MRYFRPVFFSTLLLLLTSISCGADFAKGQEAYDVGDYQVALAEWQPLADAGQADGQFGMGLLYANGNGVPSDDDQALKWYQLAADQGHAVAQCNLAVMHENGWGVPQSDGEAFRWYSLAAEQGVVPAQVSLAKMYAGGYGVDQDNVQAYKWFTIAVELSDNLPSARRDDVGRAMSPEQLTEAGLLATDWMEGHQNLLQASQQ